jgi:hypothetical protein
MDLAEKQQKYPQYGRTMPFYKHGRGMELNTLEFDGDLEVTSAFECGSGENFIRQGPDHFSVELEADPIPISEAVPVHYVCVQFTNHGSTPRRAKLDVMVHPTLREMNWTHLCKSDYFVQRGGAWSQVPVEHAICGENVYRLLVDVAPGEQVVVANEMPYAYSRLMADVDRLAAANPGKVLRRSIGRSVQGRDIPTLTFGERPDAPRLALAATPQPAEPAAWPVMGVAEFLASDDAAARAILDRFVVDLLPMTNPDGVVAGWRKVNAQGVQPLFEFDKAARGEADCVETVAEWDWFRQRPPLAFAEIHICYRRVADMPSQPYLLNRALYASDARRRVARQMDLAMAALEPDGAFRNIEPDDPVWRTLLCYQLATHFDTLAYLYQIIGLGIPDSQQRAVAVLQTLAKVGGAGM